MSGGELPAGVRKFIAENIRIVVELEVLLLLLADPDKSWSAGDLSRELRIDEQFARRELSDLVQRGLAQAVPGSENCRYGPRTPELDHALRDLARVYAERRVSVIEAIYSKPTDPIQSFADAFRLRKDEPNG